ncbi:DgyrCDS591 [Dimorphilus gyrociliatus]|uniref:DgyrCDS591 n=1 Tax=Dimorphilus gyrociliatus TaxID=2664684 RepID=A0A7I8V556_9ANNE|nr:DgyrCDS591 [Dimorphilus gyrociliatus]
MGENIKIAENLSSTIRLNDGVDMPLFGLGVWLLKGETAETAICHALKNGYKMLDTAQFYENETQVGRGLKLSGIDRKDIFFVTKVWYTSHGREGTDYIDLYLIHSPYGGKVLETYDTLLEFKSQGKIRSVGVSNFGIQHLEALEKAGRPLPSVNQIELHPFQRKEKIVKYCKEKGITVMGYSPLSKGKSLDKPMLSEMSAKYGKNVGQLMIRYSVQMGYITIPKSQNFDRIISNTDVFDWRISDEDMKVLNNSEEESCTWDPTVEPWIS